MRIAIGIVRTSVLSDKLFDSIQSLAYTMYGKQMLSKNDQVLDVYYAVTPGHRANIGDIYLFTVYN